MKCPSCGAEMKEDHLYCENCGQEIHIVPDFEPEIETSINNTMSKIADKVMDDEEKVEQTKGKHRKGFTICCLIMCALVLFAITVMIINGIQNHSAEYQISRATSCYEAKDYEKAIIFYENAKKLNEDDLSISFVLAELYNDTGREEEYVDCLISIICNNKASQDEVESAYKKLITYYNDKKDYASINSLLMNTTDETIKVQFQNYMAQAPEFSYQEGSYDEVIPLKLTSSTQGSIYYTLDGSIPNKNSDVYTTPIFLETGKYIVSAMFINEFGIESEVVAKTYVIDVIKPSAPEVETYSGEYDSPIMINAKIPANCSVYYTTDGTIPTNLSNQYTAPIPMPLGKSVYKFITYNEDEVAGECTIREFELHLNCDLTPENAVYGLIGKLINNGVVMDYYGNTTSDLNGRYLYEFQYALTIKDHGIFYVIDEIYEDSAGVRTKTGTEYAVDVNTNDYYKLSLDALDQYLLEPIQ